ncbi:MAG: TolC family protein [Desulfotomaculaceae bacterium]
MTKKSLILFVMFAFFLMLLPGVTMAGSDEGVVTDSAIMTNDTQVEAQAAPVKNLSMEEALSLAEENNSAIKQAKITRDKSKIQTDQAHSGADKIDEDQATSLSTGKVKYYNEFAAKASLSVAEKAYAVAFEQVKLLVKKHYLDVMKKKDLVNIKQEALERAQRQLEVTEVNFQVGTVAKTDVLTAQVGLAQAKTELTTANNNLRLAELQLKTDLGLDMGTTLNLIATVQYDAFIQVDLEKTIDNAMANHLEIEKCLSSKEVADENYKITVAYSAANTYNSRLAKLDVETKAVELEDAKNKVVANITGSYLSILAAEEAVNNYSIAAEQASESMRLTSLRYEVGMATSLDVLNASVQQSNVEASRVEAIYNHYLAKLTFETSKLALTN